MSNLEKIQKGMRVLQILSKIILIFAVVGVVLTSIGATLVATDVLNMENQFLHFLSVTAEISKGQLVGTLTAAAISLLFGGIITAFAYRYFTAELKEGTPFTNAGAERIKQLGIMEIVLSVISMGIMDGIYEKIGLTEWNRFDDAGGITIGICLILRKRQLRQRSRQKVTATQERWLFPFSCKRRVTAKKDGEKTPREVNPHWAP
jgi:hypothetical protein